jgi:Lysine-specific metallo-endopeptidase
MDYIGVHLYSHSSYRISEPINIIFELTNHTRTLVYILPWGTPLEGLRSNCLEVLKRGKLVSYDGIMSKKALPRKGNFIALKPGQSIQHKVELSHAYNLSGPGPVVVSFNKSKLVYFTGRSISKSKKLSVQIKPASFTVTGKQKKPTLGEIARRFAIKTKKIIPASRQLSALALNFRAPQFVNGTAEQQSIVLTAHQNGASLASQALGNLANDNNYKQWFGSYTDDRFGTVQNEFQAIVDDFRNRDFTYNLTGNGCADGDFAYTTRGDSTVYVCSRFWDAPATGTDSQAGTMVHEHSHASANTDDDPDGKGMVACRQLAADNPDNAIRNADNLEYYSKG